MRKTKIICTLGPSSEKEETIREMMLVGMDVARINFSHGDYEGHKAKADIVKRLRTELNRHTALLLDTKGPEIRIKKIKNGSAELVAGQMFTLYLDDKDGDETGVTITYRELYKDISVGGKILIDDGLIELRIESFDSFAIKCTVINGGYLSDRKGVNVPGVKLSMPFISERDREDLAFGVREDFDFIAASFTQTAGNIREIRRELENLGCDNMRIIAKIENAAGVANIEEILDVSDGIMVARGDMGVEIRLEEIPIIQKQLISRCYNQGKQVITATQMLESMTRQPRPTRAEVTDVANAIYDGTSAIMLSGETAAGLYPAEAVRTMARIAKRTESDIDYSKRFSEVHVDGFTNVTTAISHASCTTANDLKASSIITVTKSGRTARMLSRYRPETPIVGCSPESKTCRHMNMSWGVTPLLIDLKDNTDDLLKHAIDRVYEEKLIKYGDIVVITGGFPLGISGTTNMLKVQIVGNVLVSGTGVVKSSVCGILCVCNNEEEATAKFNDDEILVIPYVSPKSLNILRRASGIICELGDSHSYAAVAGEILNIPVIVGADGATKILRSGTSVTLDGEKGFVFSGNYNNAICN
ncbi:MAG: pyruvate kinase [Eubacteriales bacterium]|nr:pyruvate kinase [Eubacteriales bacterium]